LIIGVFVCVGLVDVVRCTPLHARLRGYACGLAARMLSPSPRTQEATDEA
jgi:hypothetical protein